MEYILISSLYSKYGSILKKNTDYGQDLQDYLIVLKKVLLERNILLTEDKKSSWQGCLAILYLDHHLTSFEKSIPKTIKRILLIRECIVVHPKNWTTKTLNQYDYIFSFNTEILKNLSIPKHKIIKYNLTRSIKPHEKFFNNERKRKVAAIFSNKKKYHPLSNYEYREKTIEYLGLNNILDLYGIGWNKKILTLPQPLHLLNKILTLINLNQIKREYYKGPVKSKSEIFIDYDFALCFENTIGFNGYVTEKIFDAMNCGAIPIYVGPPDIESLIPKELYIHVKRDEPLNELICKIERLELEEIKYKRRKIFDYLHSNEVMPFKHMDFVNKLINLL